MGGVTAYDPGHRKGCTEYCPPRIRFGGRTDALHRRKSRGGIVGYSLKPNFPPLWVATGLKITSFTQFGGKKIYFYSK